MLCLIFFDISAQDVASNQRLKTGYAHIAQQIEQAPLTCEQGELLLNMLYNMYLYTTYESLFKKHTFELYTQLITLHDTQQPEEMIAITKMQRTFNQAQFAAKKQMHYYQIWEALEKYIREHEPELAHLIDQLQDAGQRLVEEYVEDTIPSIDRRLAQEKERLESRKRSHHTIARIYELLVKQPELFCEEKDLINMQKINIIHGQNQSIQKNIDELLDIKQNLSEYIQSLQAVVSKLFYTVYQQLYMHMHSTYTDLQIEMLAISDDEIEESDQILPYPIVPISDS